MVTTPDSLPPTLFRRALLGVGVIAAVLLAIWIFDWLFLAPFSAPMDFAEYWAAGKLNVNGQDPYSAANVRAVQRSIGWDANEPAVMMWNPPWTLTLVMPLGMLPFQVAHGIWQIINFALILLSADLLWRALNGEPRLRWVAQVVALSFGPVFFLVGAAQITAFVLFGLAGFLYFAKHDRPFLAGGCAAITAVKPHLLSLFALWLLLDATRSAFGRKVVLGGVVVGVLVCVPPTLANPQVWSHYWEAMHGSSTADHLHYSDVAPPLLGWRFRQAISGQSFLVQGVPLVFAVAVCCVWWVVNRRSPQPREACVPWLVGFSLLVAPYGAWAFDLVLLVVPVLAVAVGVAARPDVRSAFVGCVLLLSVNTAMIAGMWMQLPSETYLWVTPVILGGCLGVLPCTRRESPLNADSDSR